MPGTVRAMPKVAGRVLRGCRRQPQAQALYRLLVEGAMNELAYAFMSLEWV